MQKHPNVTNTINYIRFNGVHCPLAVRNIFEDYKTSVPTSCSSVSTGYIQSSAVKLLDKFSELEVDSTLYRFSLKFLRDLDNRKLFQSILPTKQLGYLKYQLKRMVRHKYFNMRKCSYICLVFFFFFWLSIFALYLCCLTYSDVFPKNIKHA
jgi:hypothetical protein